MRSGKSLILLLMLTCLNLINAQTITNENNIEKNVLIITGNIESEIESDRASFYFQVNGYGNTLNTAVNTAREKVDSISDQLFNLGLTKNNLTTSKFKSSENIGDKAFLSSSKDFKALIKVQITVDSIALLEPVLTTVSLMNPDYISEINFSLKNIEEIKLKTLKDAVKKAKEKALTICETLQITLGDPIYIEEIRNKGDYPNQYNNIVALRAGFSESETIQITSLFAETIKVSQSVKVIFSIN